MTVEGLSPDQRVREPEASIRHITALDGVRGTALLMVFCFHLSGANDLPGHRIINLILKVTASGWIGVDLFFALSGFLITGILFDSLQSPHYLRNFYIRRACRIFPLYYGFILLLASIYTFVVPLNLHPVALLPLFLQNTSLWWTSVHGGKAADSASHLWSLAVEEQFYLVWPLIVLLVRERRKLLWIALLLVCAAPVVRTVLLAHGSHMEATYKLTFCRMDSLLGGAWLALMVRGDHRRTILACAPFAFAVALLGCFAIAWKTGNFNAEVNLPINQFGYTLLAVAATSFIAMTLHGKAMAARIMTARPLRFVGKYSFGLYVYQPLVSVLFGLSFAAALHRHVHSPIAYRLALESTVLVVTFAVALLSFHFFEEPFLRLKKFASTHKAKAA